MSHISLATQREVEIVEAMKRLSVADASTLSIFWVDEWGGYNRANLAAGSGTCVSDPVRPSCILTSSGATGSSSGGHYGSVMTGATSVGFPGGVNGSWYISARFLVTTAVDNNTVISTYAANAGAGGDYVRLGVCGTVVNAGGSNTKFVGHCVANGTPVVSSISIDTNVWHVARFWRPPGGTTTLLSIDSESPVSGNTYPTTLAGVGGTVCQNNGTAANRELVTDWQFHAFVRTVV